MADTAATLVKRVYDAYLAGDIEVAHEQFAEDVVGYDHGETRERELTQASQPSSSRQ